MDDRTYRSTYILSVYDSNIEDKVAYCIEKSTDKDVASNFNTYFDERIPQSDFFKNLENEIKKIKRAKDIYVAFTHSETSQDFDRWLWLYNDMVNEWVAKFYFICHRETKEIKRHLDDVAFIENALKDERQTDILYRPYKGQKPFNLNDFNKIKHAYTRWIRQGGTYYLSVWYNNLRIGMGLLPPRERDRLLLWDKPYITKKVGKPFEKDKDFFSIDISYFFKSSMSNTEIKTSITNYDFRQDAIDSSYERLQKTKKFQNVDKSYIEIKKIICRYQFKELFVVVGLRKDILTVKEDMQEELNNEKD